MSTKREMFDTMVAEVEGDFIHVFEHADTEMPDGDGDGFIQYEVFDGLALLAPKETFSDLVVRDALLLKANENDKFAFVLSNKIIHTVKQASDEGNFGQADLEALATAIQIQAIWEQGDRALALGAIALELAQDNNLEIPSLMEISGQIVHAVSNGFDIASLRNSMVVDIGAKLLEALDEVDE